MKSIFIFAMQQTIFFPIVLNDNYDFCCIRYAEDW